ncbi:MAG: PD-(D/E)XK nuclease family protein [Anaeroplasmataceae bacterium]
MLKEGIIICSNQTKMNILNNYSESNTFANFKFYTLNSFIEKITFKVNHNAVLYLMEKYNYNTSFSNLILNYLPYIKDVVNNTEKVLHLKEIYIKLLEEKLLEIDNDFFLSIKDTNITIVEEYTKKDINFIKNILVSNNVTSIHTHTITDKPDYNKILALNLLDTLDDELKYIFNDIKNKLKSNPKLSLNNFKLCNLTEEYDLSIKRISKSFNMPILNKRGVNFTTSILYKEFTNIFNNYSNYDDLVLNLTLLDKYELYNELINIFNKYDFNKFKYEFILEVITFEFEKSKYKNTILNEYIEVIDINNYTKKDNTFIYFIGFNQDNLYKINSDTDYLKDSTKELISLNTSIDKNEFNKSVFINFLYQNIDNITITSKSKSLFKLFELPYITKELNMNIVHIEQDLVNNIIEDTLYVSNKIDESIKYNIKDVLVDKYFNKHLNYKTYSNKYTKLDKALYNEFKKPVLNLSYSALKLFYECKYKYYLKYILGLSKMDSSLALDIGNFIHNSLEKSYELDFKFEDVTNEFIGGHESMKSKFYLEKAKKVLEKLIDYNFKNENKSELNKVKLEEKIEINLTEDIIFKGFIDKVIYSTESDGYVAIIDYKTGKDIVSLDNLEHGFNMQLPVYLYLIKNSTTFNNPTILGFYLQKVEIVKNLDNIEESFLLQGYTINNKGLIPLLDPEYAQNSFIDKLKIKNNGDFYSNAKVVSLKDQEDIYNTVDKLIKNCVSDINNLNFDINPKYINNTNRSCNFCEFNDICFKTNKDIVTLENKKFEKKEESINGMD